jgi:hypothetical protein
MSTGGGIPLIRNDLAIYGVVTSVIDPMTFIMDSLAGSGAGSYINGYFVFVLRESTGQGNAPQGENQPVSAFDNVTGQITIGAPFTSPLLVGDEILLIHSSLGQPPNWARTFAVGAILCQDFWSSPASLITLNNAPADVSLPSVLTNINAINMVQASLMFKFRLIENTNVGANGLDGIQSIAIQDPVGLAWTTAITFPAGFFAMPLTAREGGDVIIGAINIASVIQNAFMSNIFPIRWTQALALANDLNFNDIQMGIRVWFTLG